MYETPKITTSAGTVEMYKIIAERYPQTLCSFRKLLSPHKSQPNLYETTITIGMGQKGRISVLLYFKLWMPRK